LDIISVTGKDDLALVYLARTDDGKHFEFVESLQPPHPRNKKWILIVSTLFGCPVKCPICDAGNSYKGKLDKSLIFEQIDYMVDRRFPGRNIEVDHFKVQFARMGEPAFNSGVLDVLDEFPSRYDAPGFLPSLSSVAPRGADRFFERLLEIKNRLYRKRFQLQFSIHTTDTQLRDKLIPVNKWDFKKIASYGERFFEPGDRKIGLNFALEKESPLQADILARYFNPEIFLVKITPLNPTYGVTGNRMVSYLDFNQPDARYEIVERVREAGYDVIVSWGETDENLIGSNCGQYVTQHLAAKKPISNGYSYQPRSILP
jgi:23S rRNA (adenine2503-C2)-methyltransferase